MQLQQSYHWTHCWRLESGLEIANLNFCWNLLRFLIFWTIILKQLGSCSIMQDLSGLVRFSVFEKFGCPVTALHYPQAIDHDIHRILSHAIIFLGTIRSMYRPNAFMLNEQEQTINHGYKTIPIMTLQNVSANFLVCLRRVMVDILETFWCDLKNYSNYW